MKVAVTGGGGFIGAATVKELENRGNQAWRFDRADGNDVLKDLSQLRGADVVVHLAGELGTAELFAYPETAVEANVIGTLRVLEFCARYDIRYVGITMPDSSWANVYQATKLCAMRLATAWHRNFNIGVSHVRAFNAFGPGQKHGHGHPKKIIPTFAYHAWRGEPIPIWGSGLQTVDLIYVDDVAKVLADACVFDNDEILDAGTGHSLTVNRVAHMVNLITKNDAGTLHLPMRAGEEPETNIVAQGEGWEQMGWKPRFSVEQLRETVEWYKP
jgi:UDP-glucose 4-epimerase